MEGARSLGAIGEDAAERWLRGRGMRIVGRNLRTRAGEIDLLALDGETLVAVEVKARSGDAFGRPEEAVDGRRLARLRKATLAYASAQGLDGSPMRVDVVAVRLEGGRAAACEHFENVGS